MILCFCVICFFVFFVSLFFKLTFEVSRLNDWDERTAGHAKEWQKKLFFYRFWSSIVWPVQNPLNRPVVAIDRLITE